MRQVDTLSSGWHSPNRDLTVTYPELFWGRPISAGGLGEGEV